MARKTSVIFNTREQALSSDYNRLQQLSNKALMDMRHDASRNDYHRAGNADLSFAVPGAPRNVLQKAPTYIPSVVDFTALIGTGEAAMIQTPGPNVSNFDVIAWPDTTITFGVPDPTLSRIDVVYALTGESNIDPTVRIILQDPSTGTTAPALVNKTNAPLATIAIAAGTPNANPHSSKGVPPANSIALFEVVVTPAVITASQFLCARVTERPHYELSAAAHGLIQGISLKCEGPANESTGTVLIEASGTALNNKGLVEAVVNGRLLVGFCGDQTDSTGSGGVMANIRPDSANSPFGGSDATRDVPYFFYLIPRTSQGGGFAGPDGATPFVLVESLTVPDDSGRPVAALTVDGVVYPIADALYVGIGWKAKGQTYRKSFYWDSDDWCTAGSSATGGPGYYGNGNAFFDEDGAVGDGGRRTIPGDGLAVDFTLITRPAVPCRFVNYKARLWLGILQSTDDALTLYTSAFATGRVRYPFFGFGLPWKHEVIEVNLPPNGILSVRRPAAGSGITSFNCVAHAYKMNVNRLSSMH